MSEAATTTLLMRTPLTLGRELSNRLSRIAGRIIFRGNPDFPQWWNSLSWYLYLPKRYPDMIVRAKSDADVIFALAYARDKKLKVTVRSGGYLMGGGLGWNMPVRDIACRSILAAEVITADRRKLTVSADQNADLWWAIRGVGPVSSASSCATS